MVDSISCIVANSPTAAGVHISAHDRIRHVTACNDIVHHTLISLAKQARNSGIHVCSMRDVANIKWTGLCTSDTTFQRQDQVILTAQRFSTYSTGCAQPRNKVRLHAVSFRLSTVSIWKHTLSDTPTNQHARGCSTQLQDNLVRPDSYTHH